MDQRKSKQALDKDALDQEWQEVSEHTMQSEVITKNANGSSIKRGLALPNAELTD